MVSSRDRNCQRIEMTREVIARAPPPAFLFPNQQCQRPRTKAPNHLPAAHPFSARCRRRRLSIQPRIPCQTVFFKTVRTNPPETTKAIPSKPWQLSKENHQSSQAKISKKPQMTGEETSEVLANLLPLLPGGRFLLKPPIPVNRLFHFRR